MDIVVLAQDSGGNPLGLIILLLPIAAIIFLTVVPQRRQRRQQAELINAIAEGDEVVTIGGIHGMVNFVEDDVLHLEVDDDVVMKVSKGAISRKVGDPDPNDPASRQRGGGFLGALTGGGAAASSTADAEGEPGDAGADGGERDADGDDGPARS